MYAHPVYYPTLKRVPSLLVLQTPLVYLHEDVAGMQVPMHHAQGMQDGHARQHLTQHMQQRLGRARLGKSPGFQ